MKRLPLLLWTTLVAGSLTQTLAQTPTPPGPGPSCELRPVFIENFDEDTAPNRRIESISSNRIGPTRSTAHTPWNGDFGDAVFVDPIPGGPFAIKGGMISITPSKNSYTPWKSRHISADDRPA